MNKLNWSSEYLHECPVSHQQQYMSKVELEQQASLMYPGKLYIHIYIYIYIYKDKDKDKIHEC
jgi:hypothetical protein